MTVADRLASLRDSVAAACARADRDPAEITIVGVCKQQPDDLVQQAIAAGVRHLGENRADDLARRAHEHPDVSWHHVGQLQRRAAKQVVGKAALLHGVDRERLADTIDRLATEAGVVQDVLVQVDLTERPGRGGVAIERVGALVAYAADLPGVRVTGLMTIPPVDAGPREFFRTLRTTRDRLVERWPAVAELSMGMSGDYEIAIEEGATIIRPGTAIFGPRPQPGETT